MVHRTKTFNGKIFKSQDTYTKKSDATKYADQLRGLGKVYVRVTSDSFKGESKKYYRVWTCSKKYFSPR